MTPAHKLRVQELRSLVFALELQVARQSHRIHALIDELDEATQQAQYWRHVAFQPTRDTNEDED